MNLKDSISNIVPRENSGPKASNRFDYQKNWAICKILELHEKMDDYMLSFEYHDDIIIFDSSTNPSEVSFYQVKTKEKGNWTINLLTKQKKGKNGLLNSIIGKLYFNYSQFPCS